MKNRFSFRSRTRPVAIGTVIALAVGAAAITSSGVAVAAPATPTTTSGSDWTVTPAAGGYEVDVTLDAPLPVRDDMPDLIADGVDLGPATTSPDGLTLAVFTTDSAVASAKDVSWQWSSGGNSTATGSTTLAKTSAKPNSSTSAVGGTGTVADPSTLATGAFTTMDYNFGAQSIGLTNLGGVRGEMQGRIYLPSTKGQHPLVVFLHGRHSTCNTTVTTLSTGATRTTAGSAWPCAAPSNNGTPTTPATTSTTTSEILSYAGYDGAGESLAAAGYTVVSISVNAINAFDGTLGQDAGAAARGQAILDSLTMLKKANAGDAVTYTDTSYGTTKDVSLDQALVAGQSTDTLASAKPMTAADLVGTMDFNNIGLMGHSRGGEGAVTAGTLNEGLANPWHIKSIFALAPIDFTRATLPDVVQTTLLPYCDGDVSDQQGQHFYADSRDAFDDNVLRSDIWVMGTDHNFYNTSWTPPYPGGSDDWTATGDAVCGTSATALASGINIRLTAPQQYNVGTAYLSAFFELTLGGQTQFQGMFDGSGTEPSSVSTFADVRTVAQAPANQRDDITDFASTSPYINTTAAATATVCASRFARTVPVSLAPCPSATVALTTAAMPYWTPASYAPNVPLNQMTHLTWTALSGAMTVTIPQSKANVSGYKELTANLSPDDNVATGTDMTMKVTDTAGHSWSSLLSALNPWAVTRMPGGQAAVTGGATSSTNLKKIVLQQIHVPVATIAAGTPVTAPAVAVPVNVNSLASITFTAASGVDNKAVTPNTTTGGMFMQDLTFDTPGLGTTSVQTRSTVNVASTKVEEGSGPHSGEVAVYLSQPSTKTSSAYLTTVGSLTGKTGLGAEKVTFAPGETCKSVDDMLINGDTTPGTNAASAAIAYKVAVSYSKNAVLGINDFGTLTVREDDGLNAGVTAAPAVGIQGDACAEFAALSAPGKLSVATGAIAPGAQVAVTGSGYRSGESVSFALAGVTAPLGTAIADGNGSVSFGAVVPSAQPGGDVVLTATGAGSAFVSTTTLKVRSTTTTSLTLDPAAPTIKQDAALTATVTGDSTTGGTVTFLDGTDEIGTVTVKNGSATLDLSAGFLAGDHSLTAVFEQSDTAAESTSAPVSLSLVKGSSTIALALDADSDSEGDTVDGTVTVSGATEGTATVTIGSTEISVPIDEDGAGSFTIPADVPAGQYTVSATYDGTDFVKASAAVTTDFTVKKTSSVSVALNAASYTVGDTVTGVVTVENASEGTATVTIGTSMLSVPIGSTGTGKFSFLATSAGKYTVSVAYDGSDLVASSSTTTVDITVVAAAATTTPPVTTPPATTSPTAPAAAVSTSAVVKLSASKVAHKHSITAKVTIHGSLDGAHPTGKVEVIVTTHGVTKTKTVTLAAKGKGVVSVKIIPSTKKGSATVKAKFVGSTSFLASTSASSKVIIK